MRHHPWPIRVRPDAGRYDERVDVISEAAGGLRSAVSYAHRADKSDDWAGVIRPSRARASTCAMADRDRGPDDQVVVATRKTVNTSGSSRSNISLRTYPSGDAFSN